MEDCNAPHKSLGLCSMHYQRLRNYGSLEDPRPSEQDRFWSKVEKTDDCWWWMRSTDSHGYGQFGNRGAHRVAYEWEFGPVPPGLELDHTCHTEDESCRGGRCQHRRCVNPHHMEPVTPTENQYRSRASVSGINAAKTHCIRDHEFTPENTRIVAGKRICQTCKRITRKAA